MPSPHLTPETVEGWQRHTLPPDQLLAAADHLAACETCRDQLAAGSPAAAPAGPVATLRAELRAEAEAGLDHPEYEQLRAYLDGSLDEIDREIFASHLELCADCRSELEELRAFRALVSTYPAEEHRSERVRGWWERLFGASGSGSMPRMLLAAGSLASVVILFLVLRPDRPGTGTGTVLALRDAGGSITVDRQGRLAGLPALPDDLAASIGEAVRTHKLARPAVLDQVQPAVVVAADDAFRVEAPLATVVTSRQPQWEWELPPGAATCKVILTSVDGQARVETEPLAKDTWKPKKPLAPGKVYQWQVVALSGQGRELSRTPTRPDSARFKVLEVERAAALEQTRGTAGAFHLAMGVLYTREGLLDDAEREMDALVRLNPGAPLPASLRASLRTMRAPTGPRQAASPPAKTSLRI